MALRPRRPPVLDSNATLLRMCDVQARTGLGRTLIYKMVGTGEFPRPVRVKGRKASRWVSTEVTEFINAAIEAGRS